MNAGAASRPHLVSFADRPDLALRLEATASLRTSLTARARQVTALGLQGRAQRLAQLGAVWRTLDHPQLAAAAEQAPHTGYTAQMMCWGMRQTFGQWSADSLLAMVRDELGGGDVGAAQAHWAHPLGTVGVVLAATVPPAGLQAALLPLLLGVPVVVRAASRLAPFVEACLRSIGEVAPELAPAVGWSVFEAEDTAAMCALSEVCDVVVVHGGARAVGDWAAVRGQRPMVAHGPRLSASFLSREALGSPRLGAYLSGVALDVVAWDQSGCLSPHVLYVETEDFAQLEGLASRLVADAFPAVEDALGDVADPTGARARRAAYVRPLLFAGSAYTTSSGASVVAMERAGALEPTCGERVLVVRPVADRDELVRCCGGAAPHLQALAVGVEDVCEPLARQLASAGLNRICVHGALQRPPLSWRHDGVGTLAPLVRWVSVG